MKKNRTKEQKGAAQLGFLRTETNPRQVKIYVAQDGETWETRNQTISRAFIFH